MAEYRKGEQLFEGKITALLGRKVDLRTPQELSRYFRDEVVASARVQYERG